MCFISYIYCTILWEFTQYILHDISELCVSAVRIAVDSCYESLAIEHGFILTHCIVKQEFQSCLGLGFLTVNKMYYRHLLTSCASESQ